MLSFQDCLDLAEVTESEIEAIVKHNHIPPIVALELGHRLLQTPKGRVKLRDIITKDVLAAQARHRCGDCEKFSRTLSRYLETYSECEETSTSSTVRLEELGAIGKAKDRQDNECIDPSSDATLQALKEAKATSDCCACARLSLRLIRAASNRD